MTSLMLAVAAGGAVVGVCLTVAAIGAWVVWSNRPTAGTLIQCDSCRRLVMSPDVRWIGHAPVCERCHAAVTVTA